ncbi:hypothetical protein H074_25912 [Amycolatopsis decaplanina DSM 44594]|uniref:Uncharacterized protein n=1 Tax=Amycolatopsis decaplanina DSM 44594 TaxID=1284240 RepID=M2Z326_9PSEU|nr:hypothetical protein H074_25912 [Amycolatopsis decaplanina DSM 44594]
MTGFLLLVLEANRQPNEAGVRASTTNRDGDTSPMPVAPKGDVLDTRPLVLQPDIVTSLVVCMKTDATTLLIMVGGVA